MRSKVLSRSPILLVPRRRRCVLWVEVSTVVLVSPVRRLLVRTPIVEAVRWRVWMTAAIDLTWRRVEARAMRDGLKGGRWESALI